MTICDRCGSNEAKTVYIAIASYGRHPETYIVQSDFCFDCYIKTPQIVASALKAEIVPFDPRKHCN